MLEDLATGVACEVVVGEKDTSSLMGSNAAWESASSMTSAFFATVLCTRRMEVCSLRLPPSIPTGSQFLSMARTASGRSLDERMSRVSCHRASASVSKDSSMVPHPRLLKKAEPSIAIVDNFSTMGLASGTYWRGDGRKDLPMVVRWYFCPAFASSPCAARLERVRDQVGPDAP